MYDRILSPMMIDETQLWYGIVMCHGGMNITGGRASLVPRPEKEGLVHTVCACANLSVYLP